MGTWGDGLYDSDAALDTLGDIAQGVDLDPSPAHLAVGIGLIRWFTPSYLADRVEQIRGSAHLDAVPKPAKQRLQQLVDDPQADPVGARSEEVEDIVGRASARDDDLLRIEGGQPILDAFAERVSTVVDRDLQDDEDLDEVAGMLAPLGPLLELKVAFGKTPDGARLARWRAAFDQVDANTPDERSFWDRYVARVRRVFDALA